MAELSSSHISVSAKVFLICLGIVFQSSVEAQSVLRSTITEGLEANTFIKNIMQDRNIASSDNSSQLSFSIEPRLGYTLTESMFKVDGATGDITSAMLIDRELICAYLNYCVVQLNVKIQPAKYFEIIQVEIEILDINDNPPSFEVDTITKTISEGASLESSIALRTASDPDSPKFGVQHYEQISDSLAFSLSRPDPDTEEIYLVLKSELDRETKDVLTLKVYAHDGGTPPKSSSVTVNIVIQDINDNSPVFDKKIFDVDVAEDLGVGEIVATITANDPDLGDNGAIAYRFSSRTQDSFNEIFQIGQDSGEIRLMDSLNYEAMSSYTLNVVAENLSPGATSGETVININIIDVNDNTPEISINTVIPPVEGLPVAEVDESVNVGDFVAHITVTDADSEQNGAVICTLKDSSNSFDLVQLALTDFMIVTTHMLDRESIDYHVVTITCKDQGVLARSSAQELYVRVLDSNDNPPVFGKAVYHSGLAVNSTIGSLIAQVQATDRDIVMNGDIKYGIARGGDGRVTIDSANGTVYLADSLDVSVNQNWLNFTIYAMDKGNPQLSGEAIVAVQIFDENELVPHFTSTVYAFSVEENTAIGTSVGVVKLLNPIFPNFKPFRFDIIKIKNTDVAFAIEESSGLIRTSQVIDREEKDTYNLQVAAQSVANEQAITSIATVTIRIADQNDQLPYFIFPSKRNNTIYISHDTIPAQTIVTIAAKDSDSGVNSVLTYSIFTGDPLGYFTLDPRTGHLLLAQDLRAVDPQKFSLVIKTEDCGTPRLSEETTLNVILRSSSGVNGKLAIYLGVAFGVGLMLLVLVVVICIVLRKQKRTAQKCKKVEQMLDEKMKSLENMSQSGHLANLSHGSSEMEAQRAQGLVREDKRSSYCQNPHFGYLGDRDSDSGCSTDLSNADSNKGASNGQYSAMPNGQGFNGPLAGRVPLWNSKIPEDGPYQDNILAQGLPSKNPRGCVSRSLSASVAEQQSHGRQTDKRLSYPITSSSAEHLQIHHNQGYIEDELTPVRDVSIDSSDSENVQQQRLPPPVYSRLAKMNNSNQRIQNLADPALYEQMYYNELQQHYHPYGSRYSDDETQRGRLQSDEESNGHRSDTAVMRSHMHHRRGPGTRKRRPSRGSVSKHMPSTRYDIYGPPMLPMTHLTAKVVGNPIRRMEPQINNGLLSQIPSSSGHGTAPSSLSESDVPQSNSTSDSRRTPGVTSSDDEVNLDELGVTQV